MRLNSLVFILLLGAMALVISCAPREYYAPQRAPVPLPSRAAVQPVTPPVEPKPEISLPVLEERRIREEDVKIREEPVELEQPAQLGKEGEELQQQSFILTETLEPPREDTLLLPGTGSSKRVDESLISRITPQTSPQRAASLRLAEQGRNLLANGEHLKALSRLEKSIAVDSSNPFGYYYLARAHFLLTNYKASLDFLEISESKFASDAGWLARVYVLKGENFAALGSYDRADASFIQALKQDPHNPDALAGFSQIQDYSETVIP